VTTVNRPEVVGLASEVIERTKAGEECENLFQRAEELGLDRREIDYLRLLAAVVEARARTHT